MGAGLLIDSSPVGLGQGGQGRLPRDPRLYGAPHAAAMWCCLYAERGGGRAGCHHLLSLRFSSFLRPLEPAMVQSDSPHQALGEGGWSPSGILASSPAHSRGPWCSVMDDWRPSVPPLSPSAPGQQQPWPCGQCPTGPPPEWGGEPRVLGRGTQLRSTVLLTSVFFAQRAERKLYAGAPTHPTL